MIVGTEFYSKPPFNIVEDATYDNFTDDDLKDSHEFEDLCMGLRPISQRRIEELYDKHQDKINFITLYTNYLSEVGKIEIAQILLENHLKNKPEDTDILLRLALLYLQQENIDRVTELIGNLLNIDSPPLKELNVVQFFNYCHVAIIYFLETQQLEKALKVYSWTLDEDFEILNKDLAGFIAANMIQPLPQNFEEIEEDLEDDEELDEDLPTYFHQLELNEDPYHLPFKNYHDIFLDEISLQDIRAIEALKNEDEIGHDIKWLIKNELVCLDQHEGLFEPAGGKFAFILASTKMMTSSFETLLATLNLEHTFYFDVIFNENFPQFILNPFYHLGLNDSEPLFAYISDLSKSVYSRETIATVLAIIAKENPAREQSIKDRLEGLDYRNIVIPEHYEIVENKIPQLLQHFIDIPVDYFEEDEFESLDGSEEDDFLPESMEIPGGGIISKPTTLEAAVFSNYLLRTMEMQQENERYAPPPDEISAPLRPIVNLNKIGRNDPCPCGSGKKYKKCCLNNLN